MKKAVLVLVLLAVLLMAGCQEEQQQEEKIWGKGDLPADWQEYFGSDNTSRLDYVQSERISLLQKTLSNFGKRLDDMEDKVGKYFPENTEPGPNQ
jgi:hypothetical protein